MRTKGVAKITAEDAHRARREWPHSCAEAAWILTCAAISLHRLRELQIQSAYRDRRRCFRALYVPRGGTARIHRHREAGAGRHAGRPGKGRRAQSRASRPRKDEDADGSAHLSLQDRVTEGFTVPEGEVYQAVESPRGEMGYYIVSDGSAKPYRVHMRSACLANMQTLPKICEGRLLADVVAAIGCIDIVLGEIDR